MAQKTQSMGHIVRINEKQLKGIINTDTIISEDGDNSILYTAQVVNDPKALEGKYPTEHPNKYYHHSTNKYGRQPFDEREGEPLRLHIIGRLTTDKIDALVVDNPNSVNDIPHITLGTAIGVKPVVSNYELRDKGNMITPLDDYVDTTFTNIMAKPIIK